MKIKSLQFGKALTAALFVLLLSVAGSKNAFAQTQVATLQHGDDISVFYGATAFIEAHDEAEDGDIITLSSGTFAVPDYVTKAITLRGAGVVSDSITGQAPTIFAANVVLNVENDSVPFIMEGILITNKLYYWYLNHPIFTRCFFNAIHWYGTDSHMNNAQFINCIIDEFDLRYAYGAVFINSVLWEPSSPERDILSYNSILRCYNYQALSAFNSIIIRAENDGWGVSSSCTFINCLAVAISYDCFDDAYTSACVTYNSYEDVFESFTGDFSFEEPFVLKDEIASGFLGSDGTQVGIYGGFMPYSNRPTYMVLKRCNVANKSTIDGKLSVDIEVVTEE